MQSEYTTILAELTTLGQSIPADAVDRLAAAVESHRRVFVHATGRSGLMLRAFAMRLMQTGRCAYVAGETVTPALAAGDLLILASASGRTHSVCHNAEVAQSVGADLFILTAAPDSPLTALHPADVVLPAPSKDTGGASIQAMGSLFEQALLLFCDAAILKLPGAHEDMRRVHANLE